MADTSLFDRIIDKHPELSEVHQSFLKILVRILEHLEDANVDREFLRYTGEARLLASSLKLLPKAHVVEDDVDLAAALQGVRD